MKMEVFKNREGNNIKLKEREKCYVSQTQADSNLTKDEEGTSNCSYGNQIIAILNSQFYLIKPIGKGASGSVFLSYSIHDKKEEKTLYAIKILEHKGPNNEYINSCEVNFLEKINHKNILKVYGHGLGILETSSGLKKQVYYIIMDYSNHGSLLSQIEGNKGFGEEFGRLIFAQLLDGLEAIHNSNIVHRDIKLENIMLSGNDYTLKYVDFGFATEKSNGYLTTFLGSPNYAAPELHLKQPYLGVYEDIFSLGVTLFILVTGQLPFILPLPNDPLYKFICRSDYFSYWKNRNEKVSQSFMELFNNLIAFDPSQRPSISEIRNSKWMKEINLNLLGELQNEFNKRENNRRKIILLKQNMIKNKKVKNDNINPKNNNNQVKNADEILMRMKEKKKIEIINDIKKQLNMMNYNNNNLEKRKIIKNEIINENIPTKDNINNNNPIIKMNDLQGFIKVEININNINIIITLLRQFLKKEGFTITKKDLNKLNMEISNGENDIYLSFEKMFKETKIFFKVINGIKDDLLNFKKIMRKFNLVQEKK